VGLLSKTIFDRLRCQVKSITKTFHLCDKSITKHFCGNLQKHLTISSRPQNFRYAHVSLSLRSCITKLKTAVYWLVFLKVRQGSEIGTLWVKIGR
jgi:hypothetical protein